MQPLLQQFAHTDSEPDRQRITERIVALGLPALPAVHKASLDAANGPLSNEWAVLERRLGSVVRTARIDPRGVQPDAAIAQQLATMEGHPITASACIALIINVMKRLPENVEGMRFSAQRDSDGAGFTVLLTLLSSPRPNSHRAPLDTYEHLAAANITPYGGGAGSTSADYVVNENTLADIQNQMAKALTSGPYDPIDLQIAFKYQSDRKQK